MFLSKCVRQKANVAVDNVKYKFEKPSFDPELLKQDLSLISPKAVNLFKKIRELDRQDLAKDNKLYKHFIFCDVKSRIFGATFLASCMIAEGYHIGYTSSHHLRSDEDLLKTKNDNFFLLSSLELFGKPMAVATKKLLLKKMNERPNNVHGKLSRFIIMDSGFKEGIDLFDIKYIHIFEPSVNAADLKQVIGRGTRTCGQKGLRFQPGIGWPLYVFIYDLTIQKEVADQFMNATSLYDLYLKTIQVDIREVYFANDLQRVSVRASVDYQLNKKIHEFQIKRNMEETIQTGGGTSNKCSKLAIGDCNKMDGCFYVKGEKKQYCRRGTRRKIVKSPCSQLNEDPCNEKAGCFFVKGEKRQYCRRGTKKNRKGQNKQIIQTSSSSLTEDASSKKQSSSSSSSLSSSSSSSSSSSLSSSKMNTIPIIRPMSHEQLEDFIDKYFQHDKWDDIKVENTCGEDMIPVSSQEGGGSQLIQYTPSQQFVADFFRPSTFVKGMLLWHSVGTGKTCSAIAAATKNFEPEGYTILWVTRTTLKEDIWKNMFDQVCSDPIRQKIMQNTVIPEDRAQRMRLLSDAWKIRPLSYKQFSNLVSKNNQYYEDLVKINGREDPLRKTLLIIDEAHKLYGGGDLSGIERPDMDELKRAIMKSYALSGDDSVRLLLMTATPITENPMELIKLLNLCKPADEQMPETFMEFSDVYLTKEGTFTERGETKYMNEIAGNLSYLNREFDVRQFAQPIIETIMTEFTPTDLLTMEPVNNDKIKEIKKTKQQALNTIKNNPLFNLGVKHFTSLLKRCDVYNNKTKKKIYAKCKTEVKNEIKDILIRLKEYKQKQLDEFHERFAEVEELLKKKKEGKNEENRQKLTIYYQLLEKCSTKIKNTNEIYEVQMINQTISNVKANNRLLTKEVKDLQSKGSKCVEDACTEHLLRQNLLRQIEDNKIFIREQEEKIKLVKQTYKNDLKTRLSIEKEQQKQEKNQLKMIEDIEELYKDGLEMDEDELKKILRGWKKQIISRIQTMDE